MKAKQIIILITAGLIALSISGCDLLRKKVEKTEKVEYRLNAQGKFRLEIDNSNGSVEVEPADDTLGYIYVYAVKTGYVKYNETDKPLEDIYINIDTTDEIIKIETEIRHTKGWFKNHNKEKVDYKIKLPKNIRLVAETTNGSLWAEDLSTDIRLEAVNGSLVVNRCYGTIDLQTVNGSIKGNLDSTRGLTAETVNGSISFGGMKNANANVDISVTNGKVTYKNLNFTGMTAEKKNLSGVLGSGEYPVRINTVNGSVTLNGEKISLTKKRNDDFEIKIDFDDDDDPVKIVPKDEIEKHPDNKKDTNRSDAKTMKDTVKKGKDSIK